MSRSRTSGGSVSSARASPADKHILHVVISVLTCGRQGSLPRSEAFHLFPGHLCTTLAEQPLCFLSRYLGKAVFSARMMGTSLSFYIICFEPKCFHSSTPLTLLITRDTLFPVSHAHQETLLFGSRLALVLETSQNWEIGNELLTECRWFIRTVFAM